MLEKFHLDKANPINISIKKSILFFQYKNGDYHQRRGDTKT